LYDFVIVKSVWRTLLDLKKFDLSTIFFNDIFKRDNKDFISCTAKDVFWLEAILLG